MTRAPTLVLLVLLAPLLSGCAAPGTAPSAPGEDCVPLRLTPEEEKITPGETFLRFSVSITNCTSEQLVVEGGPCSRDVLPRLTRFNATWILHNGGALHPDNFPCDESRPTLVTLEPGRTALIDAKWNGQLEHPEDGTFVYAPPGIYTTVASALGHEARGNVTVEA